MPARLAARFKSDEVLVPQLVDNLARRKAPLPRRARHEGVPARPGGEIRQWTRQRRAVRRRRGFRGWIVDGRHDPEDVHRHVDSARNRRYFRRLEPAPVVATVCEDHDRPAAALPGPGALGGLGNRVVQRCRAERNHGRHRLGQRPQTGGERSNFVEPGIEGVDCGLVAHVKPAQKVRRSLAGTRKLALHAAADVEQQRDAHTAHVVAEIGNRAWPAGIQDFEVARGQIAHEPSLMIAHDGRNADNVHSRLERGHRLLLGEQFTCQAKTQDNGRDKSDRWHGYSIVQMHCHVCKLLML
jgi:hypothetical protein